MSQIKTRPCQFVIEKGISGCVRRVCTFAHTMEELMDPMCGFGNDCNRFKDIHKPCKHRHPIETQEEFRSRMGLLTILPSLADIALHNQLVIDISSEEETALEVPIVATIPIIIRGDEQVDYNVLKNWTSFFAEQNKKVVFDFHFV